MSTRSIQRLAWFLMAVIFFRGAALAHEMQATVAGAATAASVMAAMQDGCHEHDAAVSAADDGLPAPSCTIVCDLGAAAVLIPDFTVDHVEARPPTYATVPRLQLRAAAPPDTPPPRS